MSGYSVSVNCYRQTVNTDKYDQNSLKLLCMRIRDAPDSNFWNPAGTGIG